MDKYKVYYYSTTGHWNFSATCAVYIYTVPVTCTQIVAYSNVCNVTVVRTDTKQPSKPFHL